MSKLCVCFPKHQRNFFIPGKRLMNNFLNLSLDENIVNLIFLIQMRLCFVYFGAIHVATFML
jgi:hypothetical protein